MFMFLLEPDLKHVISNAIIQFMSKLKQEYYSKSIHLTKSLEVQNV